MKARIWGCRGSLATPGPDTLRYGGNTSCVEVVTDDGVSIVLDAGTGMRPLGAELEAAGLFDPDVHVHIWGPPSPVQPLEERIALYLSPPLFPVRLDDIPATLTFHDAPEEAVRIGSAEVVAAAVTHQGPTVGYRIEDGDKSLCYLPDHEPSLGVTLADLEPDWISGFRLAYGVDVLLHDAQYGDGEYPAHVGWGHSSIEHVLEFARRTEVGRLVLFHHDPYHDDDHLDELRRTASKLFGRGDDAVEMAYEGMRLAFSE